MEDYIQKIKDKIEAYLKSPKDSPYYGSLFKDTLKIIEYSQEQREIIEQFIFNSSLDDYDEQETTKED